MRRFFDKTVLLTKFYNFWVIYGSLANFSYWWNFGSMAFNCLIIQKINYYKNNLFLIFISVKYSLLIIDMKIIVGIELFFKWLLIFKNESLKSKASLNNNKFINQKKFYLVFENKNSYNEFLFIDLFKIINDKYMQIVCFFKGINELSKVYDFKWDFRHVLKRHYSELIFKKYKLPYDNFDYGHSHNIITICEAENSTEFNLLFKSAILETQLLNNNMFNINDVEENIVKQLNNNQQQIYKKMFYNYKKGFITKENHKFFKNNNNKLLYSNGISIEKNKTCLVVNITNLTRSQNNAETILDAGDVTGTLANGLNLFKNNSLNFLIKDGQGLLKVICYLGLCYEIDKVNKPIITNMNKQNKLDIIAENNVANILNLMKLDVVKFEKMWQQNNQQILDFLIERWQTIKK